jgi:prepilin-type N-terminal cleavage/methylation domain-containing protein
MPVDRQRRFPAHEGARLLGHPKGGSAFTLVELLVVIAIIGLLVALLLPAIQAARESARRATCQNNLKQTSLALINYHDVYRKFPYGGWGHKWVGCPDRGPQAQQPGGWIYALLPFVEQKALHDLGKGAMSAAADTAYRQRLETPLALLVCPSRRQAAAWPVAPSPLQLRSPLPFGNLTVAARSDYAMNAGSSHLVSFGGPNSLSQGADPAFWRLAPSLKGFSGISHLRRGVGFRQVKDGFSNTYLVGEKQIDVDHYETGLSSGDNESMYGGFSTDTYRFAGVAERAHTSNGSPYAPPLPDTEGPTADVPNHARFGSAHAGGTYMAKCDGSVALVGYDIAPDVHMRSGHRYDEGDAW